MKHLLPTAALFALLVLLPACGNNTPAGGSNAGQAHDPAAAEITHALCVLQPTKGHTVTGWIKFTQTGHGVRVQAEVDGLAPGLHGFHVHVYGDLSADDGTATGGHFNPQGKGHGLPHIHGDHSHVGGHAGDLGNLNADDAGHASYDVTFDDLPLSGAHAIIGRSIIIHRDEDDGTGDTGNAGPRIAQGVIGIAADQ